METKSIPKIILIVIFIILIGLFFYDFIIDNSIKWQRGGNNFCEKMGHKKMTDSMNPHCRYYGEEYRIECDKTNIYAVNEITWCVKYNRWGKCLSYDGVPTFYLYEGNITC